MARSAPGPSNDLSADPDRPLQGLHESGDHVDQRGLAAAGRADDGEELAAIHVEVHVPKGDEPRLLPLVLVSGTHATNLDQRCLGRSARRRRSVAGGGSSREQPDSCTRSLCLCTRVLLQSFAPSCDVTWIMSMGARRMVGRGDEPAGGRPNGSLYKRLQAMAPCGHGTSPATNRDVHAIAVDRLARSTGRLGPRRPRGHRDPRALVACSVPLARSRRVRRGDDEPGQRSRLPVPERESTSGATCRWRSSPESIGDSGCRCVSRRRWRTSRTSGDRVVGVDVPESGFAFVAFALLERAGLGKDDYRSSRWGRPLAAPRR